MNIKIDYLSGNGSFDSDECIEFLKEADIIVTNPPFSLFRDYVALLMQYNKKFLIIGNMNAITYKEIFPLIKDNKLWGGVKSFSGGMDMILPKEGFDEELAKTKNFSKDNDGNDLKNIMGCIWFTNIEHNKRNTPLDLYKRYNADDYPKYDNYCAFNVNKVADIPMDEYIDIEIPDDEYPFWKKAYGDDVEIIDKNEMQMQEDKFQDNLRKAKKGK